MHVGDNFALCRTEWPAFTYNRLLVLIHALTEDAVSETLCSHIYKSRDVCRKISVHAGLRDFGRDGACCRRFFERAPARQGVT